MNGDIAGATIDQLFSINDILKKFEILDKSRNSVNFLNKSHCEMCNFVLIALIIGLEVVENKGNYLMKEIYHLEYNK